MSLARRAGAVVGVALAAGAGFATAVGLIGAVWGWADALNSFAPAWLVAGWAGAGLVVLSLAKGRLRTAALVCAAVAVVVNGAALAFEMARTRPEAEAPGNLVVLTFNRFWRSPDQPGQIAMIRASGADLVALQEVDGFEPAIRAGLTDVYPYQVFCDPDCDTAVLSKRPLLATGQEAHSRWPGGLGFTWVRTTAPDGRPVTVATVHPYWPIPPWIQRGQRAHLAELIEPLARDELILVGDFNLTPWSWAMRKMDPTLAPLTRRTHGLVTFPANRLFPFLALDQVYAAPAWKTVEIRRLPGAASDHYPVRVELKR
jgi:endonuclease/exonuclease/phosphatase (EEP) superfamily protein YafD